ncbi:MAG: ABC transporter substrate-binding protein, partial [Candidatus Bathyarchaeia archaeon]
QQGFKYYLSYAAGALYHFTNQLKLIKQLDPAAKKVALIVSSADPSGDLGKGARAAANEYGFNIIYDKVYPEDMADATPMLREIAALNPDILLGATFPKSCMLIASQLRDLRIYIKWVTLDMQVTKVDFANAFGKWAVGFSQAVPSEHEVLWEKIAEREGKEYYGIRCAELQTYWVAAGGTGRIRATAIMGAAGVSLAAKLIEGSKSFDADRLIGYATTVDIYTCRGPYRCNPNNPAECLTDQQHAVMQWQRDGSYLVYKVVYPVEFATGIFIPMPTWEEKETWPELTLKW